MGQGPHHSDCNKTKQTQITEKTFFKFTTNKFAAVQEEGGMHVKTIY